jgi:hypothetical protein
MSFCVSDDICDELFFGESKPMKVFISWSGQRSAAVADALRYWLPKVIQALEPWMSADDIEKGTRWRSGIAVELEHSSVGIICLTRENLDSTWIHFEAGALSKQQQNTYVCTLLFGLEPTDVREPLAQFQATRAQREDVRKLVSTINSTLGDARLPESELSETFEVWWPKLEERLDRIGETAATNAPVRTDRDLLEEILSIVRTQAAETESQPRFPSEYTLHEFAQDKMTSPLSEEDLKRVLARQAELNRLLWKNTRLDALTEKEKTRTNKPDENPNS